MHSDTPPEDPAPPDALIVGHYGFRNLGAEAILAGILSLLRETLPLGSWLVASGDPEDTRHRHNVRAVNLSDPPAVLGEAVRSRMMIVGGGQLSGQSGSGPENAPHPDPEHVPAYLEAAQAAAQAGKPVLVWGAGVGPFEDSASRRRVEALAEVSTAFTVRTTADRAELESFGIAGALVVGDPALALRRSELPPDLNGTLSEVPRPLIAVAPRPWGTDQVQAERETQMARALDGFYEENGGTVLFVPMQEWPSGEFDDRGCCERIAERMHVPDIHIAPSGLSAGQAITALGRSDMALGMRLHGTILAAMGRTPSVSVSYHPKVARTAAEMGLGPWCLGDEPESWGRLPETLGSLWDDYADQSHLMYEWAETMAARVRPLRSLVASAIGER